MVMASPPFDKTGLPAHPVLRAAYELAQRNDPSIEDAPVTPSSCGADIARILLETGASSDPDVLGAALLVQYDEAAAGTVAENGFSPRLALLYRESSPYCEEPAQVSAEAGMIALAFETWVLEREVRAFSSAAIGAAALVMLQSSLDVIADYMTAATPPGLAQRAEKISAAAIRLMRGPAPPLRRPPSPGFKK